LSVARTTQRQIELFFLMARTGDWTPLFD